MNRLWIAVNLCVVIIALCIGCSAAQSDDDPDNDGLTNVEEEVLGTDPNKPDTDGDGLNDNVEVKGYLGFKTDPLSNDTDHDGLEDLREIWWACDPTDPYTNDIGVQDGKQVDERSTYPYVNIGNRDSDKDGLPYGAERYEIHTDPRSRSTDGDRYSDGMEYFGHQDGVDLPGYVDQDPFMPSTPDIAISVDPNVKLVLAQTVTVGDTTIKSGEHRTDIEASAGIGAGLGASTELSYQVGAGWPPWKSGGEVTSASKLSAEIEAKSTLSVSKQSRHGTLSEWKAATYTDLSGSNLRTTVKIKNIGNDMLTSQMDELLLNCYLGADDDPFWTWKLSEHPTDICNLMPGEEAIFVIEIPIEFNEFKRFDCGEALTIAVGHYSFGEDQLWLENAKSRCAIIDVDYGDGTSNRYYIPVSSNKEITLYEAYNTFGNITLSDDDKYIMSIDGKEIITEVPPYKWWSIYFQTKARQDVPANFTNTVLQRGDHLLLKYEVDTDGDHLSDKTETFLGTESDVIDTDEDGLTDGDEVLVHFTDPRLLDTDGDSYDDGTEIEQGTDPNDPSKRPLIEMPRIELSSTMLYEDLSVGGVSEAGDEFGFSVTTGDFNNDDYDDLVVGVPNEDINCKSDAGAFNVFYGSPEGLNATKLRFWHQGLGIGSQAVDRFGFSVTTGDFNNDGYDDLAVGVPNEDRNGKSNAGAVFVLYGSREGLKAASSDWWYQDQGVRGVLEAGDWFGFSVAAGDFNRDGYDDLAVGVPNEDIDDNDLAFWDSSVNAGAVNVLYGSPGGLKAAGSNWWHQDDSEDGDNFGYSVATGDFDGDGYDDLVVGVPNKDMNYRSDAGAVFVLYGSPSGLIATTCPVFHQILGVREGSEPGDHFGYSVATGDFNNDGYDDLAVGLPDENIGAKADAGAVGILYGSHEGLNSADSILWYQVDSEDGDNFGYSVATGDFNRDGYDDLVVGVPNEDINYKSDAGAVFVLYGSRDGLIAAGFTKVWHQDLSIGNGPEANDKFGYSVATGDFNNDGFDDLVVGVPLEDIGGKSDAGAVDVFYEV